MGVELKLFDTHCHLDFPQFNNARDKLIAKCMETGIRGILIPGVNREGWRLVRQITARFEICHTALGLHPMFIHEHQESHLHDLEMALSVGPIAAIGEVGLDFYEKDADRDKQIQYFEAQVAIAKAANLPLVLHVRKAHDQVLSILKKLAFKRGGICHAFNGSEVQAQRYIELGFKLGFGGAMTYPRAAKLHKLASSLPLDAIVLETDAPDMRPITCQLEYSTPLHLFDNFRSLISFREEPAFEVARQTHANALAVLDIDS